MKFLAALIISCCALLSTNTAIAGMDHDSAIMVRDVAIRATTPNAGATAAYASIHNHSDHSDTLIGASVSFAKKTELHEMKLEGDVMKMRAITGGITLPAGATIALEQGGNHVMIMGLNAPITKDGSYQITFEFAKAGTITMDAAILSLSGKPAAKSGHKHKH